MLYARSISNLSRSERNMARRTIEDILFEGTTSWNAKDEFLPMFDMLFPAHNDGCTFYQGCGEDICTLLVPNIDIHVFSDSNAECFKRIKYKLNKLLEAGYISKLNHLKQNETRLIYCGHSKVLRYTHRPISEINFVRSYGDLKLIFEFNPGTSALCRTFWDAVASQLATGGYLLGSYVDSPERLNRHSWCLSPHGKQYNVLFFHQDFDTSTKYRLSMLIQERGINITAPFEKRLINFEGSKYLVSFYPTGTGREYFFQRVENIPISTFNLKVVKIGRRMSLLQKQL